jgi:16S rRNA (uracil1498-N3)-methyltransferase
MQKQTRKNKRISRFFIEQTLIPGQTIDLTAPLVNYIVNVLRLNRDDRIILFNGRCETSRGEYSATLTDVSKRSVTAAIEAFIEKDIESPLKIHLFQGLSRGERMDFTIQKAVELGIETISPVFTQRSNVGKLNDKQLEKKQLHWQSIANSACEQSGRTQQVIITPALQVQELNCHHADLNLLLHPEANKSLHDMNDLKPGRVNLFIGPEGGLTDDEIDWASQNDYQKIKLGKRILRTETAGLAIISVLQYLWGDLA